MWKTIASFPDYEASPDGIIRSKERVRNFGKQKRVVRSQEIQPFDHSAGYSCVKLSRDRKKINQYVHRLIALTFIPNPESLLEVNHKDGDRKNNRADNLEWVSRKDNLDHARYILKRGAGSDNDRRKRFVQVNAEIARKIRQSDKTSRELSEMYGCSAVCVRRIRNNVTWKDQS